MSDPYNAYIVIWQYGSGTQLSFGAISFYQYLAVSLTCDGVNQCKSGSYNSPPGHRTYIKRNKTFRRHTSQISTMLFIDYLLIYYNLFNIDYSVIY